MGMNDLKEIKQAVVTYGLHSTFIREMVNTWISSIKSIPHSWLQLVSAALNDRPQLMQKCHFREEVKILENQRKAKALEPSQDQILDEGTYADPQA